MVKKLAWMSVLGLFLAGCAADTAIPDMPAEELYKKATVLFDKTDYEEAAKYYDEIERQHPYSEWAARAQIMTAYSFYKKNQYDDAILTLDRFIQLHPGNTNTPYAYYLKGLCYYEQMSDINREQDMSRNAKEVFEELIARYPQSAYVKDAKAKLNAIEDQLAGKEMAIGRYYLHQTEYFAAMNRFHNVITNYPQTPQLDEAYYRLTMCYLSLGMKKEAAALYAKESQKFSGSEWTKKTGNLIKKYGAK